MSTRVTPKVKAPRRERSGKGQGVGALFGAIGALNSVTRALIYIACVILTSVVLSATIITNCNDIFAFVKPDRECEITIEPGTNLSALASQLKRAGIIEHKNTFRMYIQYRHKDSDAYTPGTYTVSSSMNYDQIIAAITPKAEREMVSITIPEGYTVTDIIDLLVEKKIGAKHTREAYEEVIANGDFSDYWFVAELPSDPVRYYRLEGYLFPDTYYFYTDMTEKTVISKFLDNFDRKYSEKFRTAAQAKGYTTDQLVTLASIIQAEGKERIVTISNEGANGEEDVTSTVDYGLISSVFHNRLSLKNPMRLQSDATTLFALKMDKTGQDKVTGENKYYNNPYNTYNINGLPPGAICNPGLNALSFALEPDNSPYYYFVADSKGNTHFSVTLDEHNALSESLK